MSLQSTCFGANDSFFTNINLFWSSSNISYSFLDLTHDSFRVLKSTKVFWINDAMSCKNGKIQIGPVKFPVKSRDVWINSDSESIPIQFSIFCEFWVESNTEEAEVNWVWTRSESNPSIVKSKWIESELHCQESRPKQIKITSSKI